MKTVTLPKSIAFGIAALFHFGLAAQNSITIENRPGQPIKEKIGNQYSLNFDFSIENHLADTLKLTRLEVRLLDKDNVLIQQKFLDNNGTAPSIGTIPDNQWNGASKVLVFNPFPEINNLISKLEYTFTFNDKIEVKKTVVPQEYHQAQDFILPLKKKVLVYDGHDFNSHHRRFNYEFPFIHELGFTANFMRYAYDFAILDPENRQFSGKGEKNEEWFGFASEVLAVADGEIIDIVTNQEDNKTFDVPSLKDHPLALYGNYVVIKHAKGVYSMYGHLKNQSSSGFTIGDKVKKGQVIGLIGTSGSSFFPHLHFEVRNSIAHEAEGIPSYFSDFYVILGSVKQAVKKGTVNTGDIIQSK